MIKWNLPIRKNKSKSNISSQKNLMRLTHEVFLSAICVYNFKSSTFSATLPFTLA